MAALMTPSRFSNSMSGSQAQYGANSTSMADSLPSIDFGFSDLRERMAQFTVRFDDFIERGRKRVLEERNAFRVNVAELEESQRSKEQAIIALESKSTSLAQTLAKEAAETEEMHDAIHGLAAQKEEHLARRDTLRSEIADVQRVVKQRRDAQAAHQRTLDSHARHNIPELRFWEHCLGMRIEGTGVPDRIRIVFLCIDERDTDKECWFELQMGSSIFEVGATKPKLNRDSVDETQEKLNESRELGEFLKSMRMLFVQGMKGS
ncbi:kinetochore-associated Ndc80 complex subunit spc25 [Elasticomyces elasticus]|nr:kinetochore-associated Ndc80 complex subunit spc25 [Elasticomyces elasticus]KAK3658069.1 kinetochore-associated Ndc80 complex subunit spc25 [Elasticomyces elasticus]KAK4923533.1 kinetochore-associated Ndc80 complex subunit spc25 [Elasticomyces elasticus]KAK5749789.1 kinetochore-associated Ndc80 complex subunit spc25 [Elasticomyces elasticus]